MGSTPWAFRKAWCPTTRYQFSHRNYSPSGSMAIRREACHRRYCAGSARDTLTTQNRIVLLYSKYSYKYFIQHDIFGLQVPVDDLVGVQFAHSWHHLSHDHCHFGFGHGRAFLHVFIKLAAQSHLHYNVDVNLIIKVTIHFYYIWVIQEQLYFQLPDKLFRNLFLLQHLLLYNLQRAKELCLFLFRQEYLPILPTTQLVDLLEIMQRPLLLFLLSHRPHPPFCRVNTAFPHFHSFYWVQFPWTCSAVVGGRTQYCLFSASH